MSNNNTNDRSGGLYDAMDQHYSEEAKKASDKIQDIKDSSGGTPSDAQSREIFSRQQDFNDAQSGANKLDTARNAS